MFAAEPGPVQSRSYSCSVIWNIGWRHFLKQTLRVSSVCSHEQGGGVLVQDAGED